MLNTNLSKEVKDSIQIYLPEYINWNLNPLTPDASDRRYYRLESEVGETLVLVTQKPFTEEDFNFLQIQKLLKSNGIRVPEVKQVYPFLGFILLEDLGDISLQSYLLKANSWGNSLGDQDTRSNKITDLPIDFWDQRWFWSCQAVNQMAHCQSIKKNISQNYTCFDLSFDEEKLNFEWNWTWTHLVEPRLKLNNLDLIKYKENWLFEAYSISKKLAQEVRVLTHRDFHSRNLMVKNNELIWIDFQDARMGTLVYDLSSLICDSYLPFSSAFQKDILDYAYSIQIKNQVYDREIYNKLYSLQSFQRILKAAGSFASFYNLKSDSRYLPYLPKTLESALFMAKNDLQSPQIVKSIEYLLKVLE